MEDYEIRLYARQRYRRHIGLALLLGWISSVFEPVTDWTRQAVWPAGGWGATIFSYVLIFLTAPLVLGALACVLQLFEDDRADLNQLRQFYRRGQWLHAIALLAVQQLTLFAALLAVSLTGVLVFRGIFAVFALLAGLTGVAWLYLRMQLAPLLLVTGENHGAVEALIESFGRMRGNVWAYVMFLLSVQWIPVSVSLVGEAAQMAGWDAAWWLTLTGQLVSFGFAPYIILAQTGWLAQRIRRCPQESDPQNPLLHAVWLDRPAPDPKLDDGKE